MFVVVERVELLQRVLLQERHVVVAIMRRLITGEVQIHLPEVILMITVGALIIIVLLLPVLLAVVVLLQVILLVVVHVQVVVTHPVAAVVLPAVQAAVAVVPAATPSAWTRTLTTAV